MKVYQAKIASNNIDVTGSITETGIMSNNNVKKGEVLQTDESTEQFSLFNRFIKTVNKLGKITKFEIHGNTLVLTLEKISEEFYKVVSELEELADVRLRIAIDSKIIKLTPF